MPVFDVKGIGQSLPFISASNAITITLQASLFNPVDPSFRALSGRLKFTIRRHKFNKESVPCKTLAWWLASQATSTVFRNHNTPSLFFFITLEPRVE